MTITAGQIQFFKSAASAGGNTSLGGGVSDPIVTATLDNLFPTASSDPAQQTTYRCIYVGNTNGSITLTNARVFISQITPSTDSRFEIAFGSTAAAATGSETAIADEEDTAASLIGRGIVFTAPLDYDTSTLETDIPAGFYKAIWLKRIIEASADASSLDNMILRVQGQTVSA